MDMLTGEQPNDKDQVLAALREQQNSQEPTGPAKAAKGTRRQPVGYASIRSGPQGCRCSLGEAYWRIQVATYIYHESATLISGVRS